MNRILSLVALAFRQREEKEEERKTIRCLSPVTVLVSFLIAHPIHFLLLSSEASLALVRRTLVLDMVGMGGNFQEDVMGPIIIALAKASDARFSDIITHDGC